MTSKPAWQSRLRHALFIWAFFIKLSTVDGQRWPLSLAFALSAPFRTFGSLPSSSNFAISRLAVAGETLKLSIIWETLIVCISSSNDRMPLCLCTSFIFITLFVVVTLDDYFLICFDSNNHICDCQILAVVKCDFNHKVFISCCFCWFLCFWVWSNALN